jgi:Ni,Fe-hydrogenase III component G
MNSEEMMNLAEAVVKSWDWATEVSRVRPNQLEVRVNLLQELVPIVVGLRVKRLGYLSAIVGLDLGPEENEMEVLYHFCPGDVVISLRVRIPRDGGIVPSLSGVVPSAEVFERELHEMFGIELSGLENKEKLYLPEDWPDGVYPLRKDFEPGILTGKSGSEEA